MNRFNLPKAVTASIATIAVTIGLAGLAAAAPAPAPTPAALAAQIAQAVSAPTTVNLTAQVMAAANSSYEQGPCVQNQSVPGDRFTGCDFGNPTATKTVVLLGDSQAAMWLPAFDAAGKAHNFHVVLLARLGCNSNPLVLKSFTGSVDTQCAIFRTATLKYLKTLHAPAVFVSQLHRYPLYANGAAVPNAAWTTSMNTLFASLKATGASSVSFIEPAPVDPVDAAGCLSRNMSASQKCNYSLPQGIIADARASDDAAALASHVPTINTFSLFCTSATIAASTICPAQVAGLLVYADRWHTTSQYSAYAWQALAALAKL